jgi:RimJ/RimL family protein N-acetyltransferase
VSDLAARRGSRYAAVDVDADGRPRMSASVVDRGRELLRREGPLTVARKALRVLLERVKRVVRIDDEYVWYALDPTSPELPDLPIPEGTSLRRVKPGELDWLEPALGVEREVAQHYVDRGELPFVVEEDGQALFSCWVFLDEMPTFGWTPLPADVACLEHSHVAPPARGRRLGPSGALAAMRSVGEAGQATTIITKIGAWNEVSLRAFLKSGFHEVARVRATRTLGHWRVRVTAVAEGLPSEVTARLER